MKCNGMNSNRTVNCKADALPGMVVCAEHVTPSAVYLLAHALAARNAECLEIACAAVCKHCIYGNVPVKDASRTWTHRFTDCYVTCLASPVRSAFAERWKV